jgi:hypothetical protein
MAVEAYDVLASFNRMLQYQESRESRKVSEALAYMQIAQQQRTQDIAVAGKNLEIMSTVNQQLMTKKASEFIYESGLSGLYAKHKDEKNPLKKARDELMGTGSWWGDDEYEIGLDKDTANDLVSALWSAQEAQNPEALLKIGSSLSVLADPSHEKSKKETRIIKSLGKLGYFSDLSDEGVSESVGDFLDMDRLLNNQNLILKETEEYLKGEYDIQQIDLYSDASKVLSALEEEGVSEESQITDVDTTLPLDEQVAEFDALSSRKQDEINLISAAIDDMESQIRDIRFISGAGKEITQQQQDFINREDEMKSEFEKQISLLNSDIEQLEKDKKTWNEELYMRKPVHEREREEKLSSLLENMQFQYFTH